MLAVKLSATKYHKNLSFHRFQSAMQDATFCFWQRHFLNKKVAAHLTTFSILPEVFSSARIYTYKILEGRKGKKDIKYLF